MSLADELLADLEEGAEEEEEETVGAVDEDDAIEEVTEESAMDTGPGGVYDRVTVLARLRDSDRFQTLTERLRRDRDLDADRPIAGPVEADPEYQFIVDLNQLASEIDNEINVIHKFVRDKYQQRFPELESLVPNPLEFLAAVQELGNDIQTKAQNKDIMGRILLPATVIVVSMTASTTQGAELTPEQLAVVLEGCTMAFDLQQAKMDIYKYVEQRMAFIAPNLSALVGAGTAAMLMGQAGGLTQLSKMPSCNVLVLGAQRRTLAGFSSSAIQPHTGYLFYSQLVQSLPPDLRRKGARLVAAKCTLAARVDAVHSSTDGAIGRQLFEQVEQKMEKMVEPPPVKHTKALPKPLDQASKKRGGRRVRKMKERLGMTELRRKANRVNFGELAEDVMQEKMGFGLGQVKTGPAAGGRLRGPTVDPKTRARMSQKLQKTMQKQNQTSGGATSVRSKTAGTASSVTFTPVQGLEIVNPQAMEKKIANANATYFSATAGFVKVQTPMPGAKRDTA